MYVAVNESDMYVVLFGFLQSRQAMREFSVLSIINDTSVRHASVCLINY
jgi:hypothetical protein